MKKVIALRGQIATLVVTVLLLAMSQQVLSAQGAELEPLTKMTDYIKAAAILLILLITVTGFIWIGWGVLAKFNEARSQGTTEWGEVGLFAVVAVGVLVFLGYLLDQASTLVA